MDSHWSKFKIGAALGKIARVAAATSMLALTFGPGAFQTATPVSAANAPKNLQWGDARPVLTTIADSADVDGFQHLPDFGFSLHAITVAPNGDIFAAGTGADVNVDGGTCGQAVDANGGPAGTGCDAAATSNPAIYKSVDGGKSWRSAYVVGANAAWATATTIQQIVVSPDYPGDIFVAVVFTDFVNNTDTRNGLCWSTDGGLTFPLASCATGANAGTDPDLDDTMWRTVALSPDFNWNDSSGQLAMGGTWAAGGGTACSVTATTTALKAALAATTFTDVNETTVSACNDVADSTLSLAYNNNEEPIALARLHVANALDGNTDGDTADAVDCATSCTFGQVKTAAAWPAAANLNADEINDNDTTDLIASTGRVMFDDTYTAGGSFYAVASNAAGTLGGVFFFNGTGWNEKTLGNADCNLGISDFIVTGDSSTAKLAATVNSSNRVCRSSNAGSSWSKADADGGDAVCSVCNVTAAGSITRLSVRRSDPTMVYYTTSGALGGVMKSITSGSSWADTGLTNEPYISTSVDEVDTNIVLETAKGPTNTALFKSEDYGTGATYKRVIRYTGTDLSEVSVSSDFATLGIAYAVRTSATTDVVIKTTDGGNTWDNVSANPFEASPESSELIKKTSQRTGTTVYFGGTKGHVASTTDGGATWTLLAKDFGNTVYDLDFADATNFFATAFDTDSTQKVWQTKDGGATFTQLGDAPWGSGEGNVTTNITGYKPADNSGYVHILTAAGVTTAQVWRIKIGDTTWTQFKPDAAVWTSFLTSSTGAAGVGDGMYGVVWSTPAGGNLMITFYPNTGDKDQYNATNAGDDERKNLYLQLPVPSAAPTLAPIAAAATMGTTKSVNGGYHIQTTTLGRILEMTLSTEYLAGVKLTSPVSGSSAPSNVGTDGIPSILRWASVTDADSYDLMMGLDPNLSDGAFILPTPTTNLQTITAALFPLVQGNTYYWKVRVETTHGAVFEGPWSATNSFSVSSQGAPTSPAPSLPQDGAQLPGLSTQLSWNNPAGVTQVQVQVTPFNGDGPAINLILGSAVNSYDVPAPLFGTGPYVMLPGASYTWRVRTTTLATAIGENDSSWGPWSTPRVFTTAAANAGTVQLLAPINGAGTADTTPTLQWKDGNSAMFYYEVQLSSDPNFGESGAVAPVQWQLIHGGVSTPADSYTVPDAAALKPGTYFWRVRQRTQATSKGSAETGIAWSPAQTFVIQ